MCALAALCGISLLEGLSFVMCFPRFEVLATGSAGAQLDLGFLFAHLEYQSQRGVHSAVTKVDIYICSVSLENLLRLFLKGLAIYGEFFLRESYFYPGKNH